MKKLLLVLGIVLGIPFSSMASPSFKIGVTLPLTGGAAEWGVAARNGFLIAKEEHPELLGTVEFIFEDTQLDPKTAVSAFRRLVDTEGVLFNYDFGSATSSAIGPIAEREQVLLMSSAFDPSVSAGKNHVIRFANYSAQYIQKLLGFLRSKGHKNYALVVTENAFFRSLANAFEKSLSPGEKVEIYTVQPTDNDFRSTITRLKAERNEFEALGLYVFAEQGPDFLRQATQQQLMMPLFGTDAFESTEVVRQAAGSMNGMVFPNNSVTDDFKKRYRARFGNENQVTFAGSTYDLGMLVGRLTSSLEGVSREQIQNLLEKPGTHDGVLGSFEFRSEPGVGKYFAFPIVLKQVDGESISIIQ